MTTYHPAMEEMECAGIQSGLYQSLEWLWHGFEVLVLTNWIPLNMVRKWMGHTLMEVTHVYAKILSKEQCAITDRMWHKAAYNEKIYL